MVEEQFERARSVSVQTSNERTHADTSAAPQVAVVCDDVMLGDALAAAATTRSVSARSAVGLPRDRIEEIDAVVVVPNGNARSLGEGLALWRRKTPSLLIVGLSADRQQLAALAASVGTEIETATTVRECLAHLRRLGARLNGLEEPLTVRHLDILTRVGAGLSPTEVAADLRITMKTLNNHLGAIYRRLQVNNLTHAVLRANRLGLIELI
jgi:DNA-binding NarL/FixJ family response regulator